MTVLHSDVRLMIAVRVVIITSLLLATLIIQFTVNLILPINYLYLITGLTYVLTLAYILAGKLIPSRSLNLYLQFGGDLLVETVLVYFTGGLDSPFSFLYLVSIITASMMLYRRGGMLVASGSVILYGGLADLMYYGVIPLPSENVFSLTPWTSMRLYVNMITNFAGYYATALLTSYISEQLRKTFAERDTYRRSFAELQALNQNVLESIPSGLLTVTTPGVITFANPAACSILGREAGILIGRTLAEIGLFSEEDWTRCRDEALVSGVARGEKNDFFRAAEMTSLGYAITPLQTLSGEPSGLSLIFQDLTEVKKLEAQLRLKDRMAAVGELSAGIAHEIRNPLAAIAGSVQVLRSSLQLSPQEQRLMSIILKESDRLNKSIADFLRFVKPQERNPSQFDIAASLTETLELLANSPELQSNHRIEWDIDPPSVTLVGDADQIRQVFWNLAKNAIQAMTEGGELRVKTAIEDDAYKIMFIDSGRGMSERELQMLFQPFRTNFPSGTGLGMAISYRIIQEHGGRIEVASRERAGTTITLTLPMQGQPQSEQTLRALALRK